VSSTEADFSVTVKTPKGNLVTVRGDSADEWLANLNAAGASGALGVIAQIEASLSGQSFPVTASTAGPQPAARTPSQPAQELPAGFAEVKCVECQAPTRLVQEGTSKKSGNPYKRYSCTVNQLHKSTFTS